MPGYVFLSPHSSRQERYNLARKALQEAMRLSPADPGNQDTQAQVQIRLGLLEKANATLEKALSIEPRHATAHLHLG